MTPVELPLVQFKLLDKEMHAVQIGLNKPILITGQRTQYIKVWNISTITAPVLIREFFSHVNQITSLTTIDAQKKTCLVTSKDGFFSIIDMARAHKHVNHYINCCSNFGVYC
jgi:WD40 repeat protein